MNIQQHRQHIMRINPSTMYSNIFNNGSLPNGAMIADELFVLAPEPELVSVSGSVPSFLVSSFAVGSDSPMMGDTEGSAVGSPTITI